MKGKAITKIVICSIVAVLLTGILLAGVLGIEVFRALPGIREFKEETGRFFIDLDKYDNENSYNIGSAELDSVVSRSIREIDLNWASGSVTVKPYNGDQLILRESEGNSEAKRLRWKVENGKLTIDLSQFREEFDGTVYAYRYLYGRLYRIPSSYDAEANTITLSVTNLGRYVLTDEKIPEATIVD